jgi:DTW domain-containing protein YfiP
VVPTRSRLLVLQHPREHGKAIGTARIAALGLPNAQIEVGVDFSDHPAVQAALRDPERPPVLLFPGEGARDLASERPDGPVTLVVIDGTWHQARSLFRANPWLTQLPRYAFAPERPSEYRIRREPRIEYVSTIEAVAQALGALEGDRTRFAPLLAPFRAMVDTQLGFASRSTGGRKRLRRRGGCTAPPRLPSLLMHPNIVCVMAEANAATRGEPGQPARQLHELVYWTALRLGEEAHFDALIAPRRPLTPSPMKYGRLDPDALQSGQSVAEFTEGWQTFLHPDDVLCCWGRYGIGLLAAEGVAPPERLIDMRKVMGDYLQRRPGAPEALLAEFGVSMQPHGLGRGGERLGVLVSLTRALRAKAIAYRPANDS